jgi:CRISPR-associated protein Csx17
MMEAFRSGHSGVPLHSSRPARLDDVIQFLNGETDDDKLAELLWGLLGVESPAIESSYVTSELEIPFEFGVPRLLVQGGSFIADQGHWHLAKANFSNATADPEVFHLLARGGVRAVDQCVTRAARRLKSGGLLVTGYRNRRHAGRPMAIVSPVGPSRLLAAIGVGCGWRFGSERGAHARKQTALKRDARRPINRQA